MAATDELTAPDDKTIHVPAETPVSAAARRSGKDPAEHCPMMPERLAETDAFKQITEMVGSGPYPLQGGRAGGRVAGGVPALREIRAARRPARPTAPPGPRSRISTGWNGRSFPTPHGGGGAAERRGGLVGRRAPTCCRSCARIRSSRWRSSIPPGSIASHAVQPAEAAVQQSRDPARDAGRDRPGRFHDRHGRHRQHPVAGQGAVFSCPGTPMASDAGMDVLTGRATSEG